MNYDEMSDLEINKLVAEKLGLLIADEDSRAYSHGYREKYPSTIWVAKHKFGNQIEPWEQMNFVKTPNEYMPIAIENDISLILDDVDKAVTNNPYEHLEPHGSSERDGFYCEEIDDTNNMGRAICIVYLKMMDAKK